jgi:hypothetical protein
MALLLIYLSWHRQKQGIQQTFFLAFFRIEGGEGAGNSLGLNERPSLAFF